jgi:hypothetical protein
MGQYFRPCGERVVFTNISKDKSGKQVTFKTVVDALNFMSQRGWVLETEFSENYIDEGSSYGGIKHCIISKTLAVDSSVQEALKQ